MFTVGLKNGGFKWYLKCTTWTSELEQADKFASVHEAGIALDNAKKFMHVSLKKKPVILKLGE